MRLKVLQKLSQFSFFFYFKMVLGDPAFCNNMDKPGGPSASVK